MRRAAFLAAVLVLAVASVPSSAGAGPASEAPPVDGAVPVTVQIEAETLLEVARDGTIVRVSSNANPPDYRSAVLCAYTFTTAPCTLTSGLLDQLAALPLRRHAAYGTVYP